MISEGNLIQLNNLLFELVDDETTKILANDNPREMNLNYLKHLVGLRSAITNEMGLVRRGKEHPHVHCKGCGYGFSTSALDAEGVCSLCQRGEDV